MEESRISHYRLGRLLGRGGMGEVYEAEDLDLGRRVALKFIAPELAADPENLKRFEREARSAAALNHPHIATLYAFERDGGRPFISMELVPGESLRARIRRGRLSMTESIAIMRDVAGALATAHRRGIVHRDIKPENLMFDEDGRVKVMDFGLARAVLASQLTMTGTTLGTAGYMAPESLRGQAGTASDVFALGVVLHEMLAGELPFAGDTPLALMFTIANEPPRPLREARPEAPEELERLIARLLEKDPARRPDAATAARDLATLAGSAPPPGAEIGATAAAPVAGSRGSLAPRVLTEDVEIERLARGELEAAPPSRRAAMLELRRPRYVLGQKVTTLRNIGILVGLLLAARVIFDLRGASAHKRDEALVFNNLGTTALLHDSLDRAQSWFGLALHRDPDFAPALINLGQLYRRKGNLDSAAVVLTKVTARAAKDRGGAALAFYGLGQLDLQSGAYDGAAQHLARGLALDSTHAEFYNDLGWALANSGHAADAQRVLALGLGRFPDLPQLHKNMALALGKRGDYARGIEMLDEVIRTAPDYAPAWGLRSVFHDRLGDAARARTDWAAYLALAPDTSERAGFEREKVISAETRAGADHAHPVLPAPGSHPRR